MSNTHHDKLSEAELSIHSVIYLSGALVGDAVPDELEDLCDEIDDLSKVFPDAPEDVAHDSELLKEWLLELGRFGYLVKFATPVMRRLGSDATSFSWSRYYTRWVYAETMDDAIELGTKWAAELRTAEQMEASEA